MRRSWNTDDLIKAVKLSTSYRNTLKILNLQPTGGNYSQLKKYIEESKIDITHFTGKGWSRGKKVPSSSKIPLEKILVINSNYQSYKLRNRLFEGKLKIQQCEECGWHKESEDGRIPLELDHINGDHRDNRIENLRVLCPNCHSLKLNHRGKNKKNRL